MTVPPEARTRPRVEVVSAKDVASYAERVCAELGAGDVVPVSRHRARAWACNPCADPDDPALLVAWQGGRCAGYLGLFAGRLQQDGRVSKVFWLSTFYVPPAERHSGIGALLLMRAIALRRDLAVTLVSPEAAQLYQALRFRPLPTTSYLVCELDRWDPLSLPLRLAQRLLRERRPALAAALDEPASRLAAPFSGLLRALLAWRSRASRERVVARELKEIPADALQPGSGACFARGADVANWMLQRPWVTTDPASATAGHYFDDYRRRFGFVALELKDRDDGRTLGHCVLRLQEKRGLRELLVLDHDLRDSRGGRALLELALERASQLGAQRITVPLVCQQAAYASPLLRVLFRTARRSGYGRAADPASPLAGALDSLVCSPVDGDVAFA